MHLTKNIFVILLFFSFSCFPQQKITCKIKLDEKNKTFKINQTLVYTNLHAFEINKLILQDWNHSFSNRKTHFAKKLSDQFIRNFHLSNTKERGFTTINAIKIENTDASWNRIDNQIDLIHLNIPTLKPNDSIQITMEYELKLPSAKFNKWGRQKENYYLKDCFLLVTKILSNQTNTLYSNENTEDATVEDISHASIKFDISDLYTISSNLEKIDPKSFSSNSANDFIFAIEKNKTFESYTTDKLTVDTNIESTKTNEIQRALVIDRIVNYFEKHIGPSKTKKIIVSQMDYEQNPFYGLNLLPQYLSPFPNSFLFELKFLKAFSYNYLKAQLHIDFRKDYYLLDAIQLFFIMNYMEEYYPDMKALGTLGEFKITQGYQLAKAKFNDQFYLAYLLMARKNLDQPLNESKEKLIKFNEKIASKYKAGLAFKFLDTYLKNDIVTKSIQDYIAINRKQYTNSNDFKKILQSNCSENVDWFFNEIINSDKEIDYNFGKYKTNTHSKQIEIINKNKNSVPFLISGYKKSNKVFEKWHFPNSIKDSAYIIDPKGADKLVINTSNYFAEINNRNNYKSIKGFLNLNKPFKFTLIRDIENAKYNQVFYFPEIGYNLYDGAILSIAFNNRSFIERPFNYHISPSYSAKSKSLTGSLFLNYVQNIQNKSLFQVRYSLSNLYYHYIKDAGYYRISPMVQFRFRDKDNISKNRYRLIQLREVIVNREYSPLIQDNSPDNYAVFDSKFALGNNETAKGINFNTNLQFGNSFSKLANEFSYRKLFENNYQVGLRFYTGFFLHNNSKTDFYNFGLDRPKDYLFDYQFYGRNEKSGFFSQQIIIAEGGFKSKFVNPYANQWMTTANITSSLWKWINLYADLGAYKNKYQNPTFVYDSGIHFNLVPDYFEIYCPIYSKNGWEIADKNYHEKIRFQFTLNPKVLIGIFTRKWF